VRNMTGLGEKVTTSTITPWSFFNGISEYRKKLNLPNPGTFEGLHKEVKGTNKMSNISKGKKHINRS
jgi:hypothetical protein